MIKNFKEKYIKNLFFYHIYRYFKYKFKYFKSYGATGEDVLLNKIFKNNLSGFYLDIGSLHPINGSLTYNLYQKGGMELTLIYWKAILDYSKSLEAGIYLRRLLFHLRLAL